MSPSPSPCDGFSGNLPAYLDRELGPAEHVALEGHLDGCRRCQDRLKDLEAVSAVLKGWDASTPVAQVAPARLQHAVLSRIAPDGARRRRELRWLRVRRFALAASALLAVGLPPALGWARREAPEDASTGSAPALSAQVPGRAGAPTSPALPSVALPALVVPSLGEERLAARPWPGVQGVEPVPAFPEADRERLLAAALPAQRALEQEAWFEARTGIRGVWVVDAARGRRLLLTPQAAQFFAPERDYDLLRRAAAEPYTNAPSLPDVAPPLAVADALRPLLSGDEGSAAWRARQRVYAYGEPGTSRHLLDVYALPDAGSAWAADMLDPVAAEVGGVLRLEPSGQDDGSVIALVAGSRQPILLLAGHLLSGGETDRVVARSAWLPASPEPSRWQIACVPVRVGARRAEGGIHVTPFLAGPTLRALLASGASAERVLEHARALRAAAMGGRAPLEWSLLDLYAGPQGAEALALPALAQGLARAPAGVIVADPSGALLGLDHVEFGGPAADLLLRRLVHGYQVEALQRHFGRMPAAPAAGQRLEAAFARAAASASALTAPPVAGAADVPGVKRLTAQADDAGLALEALEVIGRGVLLSALPKP